MTKLTYSLSVTDWTKPRGYRDSGRGWRVSLIGMPQDDWNAMGVRVHESFHRSVAAANKTAAQLARVYGLTFQPVG